MEREHTVSVQVTNGSECIYNPEILLGTNYGLWNFKKEVAPRGTLLDLNAAWELFLSRQTFDNNIKFEEVYHHQHEVLDGITYEEGDTTYTLVDDKGNPTNASFTIKANKGPVEHIEWQNGNLVLYYTKTRSVTSEDKQSGTPLHYVYDSEGNVIVDTKTGKPLIYEYVKIPVIEIFDNDETHKLFPWFADDQHTIRTRQNLDEDSGEHLGDFAITKDSEVFFAKEKFPENEGNTLISLQSIYNQLKKDLGFNHTFETVNDLQDIEGNSIHQRVNGNDLEEVLNTENKDSIISALNELLQRIKNHNNLDFGAEVPLDGYKELLNLITENIKDRTSLVNALNWIQNSEIGQFAEDLDFNSDTITNALNLIFKEAEENRKRIGWDGEKWIVLTTKNNSNLSEAINEVDLHVDKLNKIIGTSEYRDSYTNPNISNIIKDRLRITNPIKDDITIVEALNDLQDQNGDLKTLTTASKTSTVSAINELDSEIGDLKNLTTDKKANLVEAFNEINSNADTNTKNIGDLSILNTEDQTDIVSAINEVINESPFVYQDTNDPDSGVVLKNSSNKAGEKSLVIGKNNEGGDISLISGKSNKSTGNSNFIQGTNNSSKKDFNTLLGQNNVNNGNYNLISGKDNTINGDYNLVHGSKNTLLDSQNSVVLGTENEINCDNIIALGSNLKVKENTENGIIIGSDSTLKKSNSISVGFNNSLEENSRALGNKNESIGKNNTLIGNSNYQEGDNSTLVGNNNSSVGNNNYVLGKGQQIEGNNNISIGTNQQSIKVNDSIVIGNIEKVYDNSTHIGNDIYIQTHDSESKLQSLIFVDLNDWCKKNNAASLNGEKFLDSSHLVQALKVYLSKEYIDSALIRFRMQDDNENGFILVQGKSKRIYLNGTWYFSDNIENGWSRHDGTYLKVIENRTVNSKGETITKHYLAFMDQLSTEPLVDTVGAQRSNTEDFKEIDLTHAYGAVDIDDIDEALELKNRFKNKVDKYAKIITNYYDENGIKHEKVQNFIDPSNPNISKDIILDLEESFGLNSQLFQLKTEKGQVNGYVPLNSAGIIDAKYLPSYVDDVIDVWAEYKVDDFTGAIIDIHLYEIIDAPTSANQDFGTRGREILQGEIGKIYVQANPSARQFSTQFRWTGTQFVAIGFSNISIGEAEGTAYDGAKGKELSDNFIDHINSGTTNIPLLDDTTGEQKLDENGNPLWVIYKPNPHNVKAEQLPVVVNDPNDLNNVDLLDTYTREYNVLTAIQELFERLNFLEDKSSDISRILGGLEEFEGLDDTSIIETILNLKESQESYIALSDEQISDYVLNNLKFYGED